MTTSQQDRAAHFHALHTGGGVLAPANAWDVASACVSVFAGVRAVATTSAGVAWSLGAADGDRLDRTLAVDWVARVVSAVDVPVTADIETGFGATPAEVADTVRAVLAAGAVGVNLEDSSAPALRDTADQAARIAAATDTYLRATGTPGTRLAEAAYALARRATEELLTLGNYDAVRDGLPWSRLNDLLTR